MTGPSGPGPVAIALVMVSVYVLAPIAIAAVSVLFWWPLLAYSWCWWVGCAP